MQAAGIPGTPHALRHWFATTLRAAGVDTLVIKELMGHDSMTTTAIYIRIPATQQAAAVRSLPGL
jgi:integrase/recombinase XerD